MPPPTLLHWRVNLFMSYLITHDADADADADVDALCPISRPWRSPGGLFINATPLTKLVYLS